MVGDELPPHHVSSGSCSQGRSPAPVTSALPRERAHGQGVLLVDGVQLFSVHGLSDELKLLRERLAAVRHADVGDVGTADVVAHGTLLRIVGAQPVAFGLEIKGNKKLRY